MSVHIHKWGFSKITAKFYCIDTLCGKGLTINTILIALNKREQQKHLPRKKKI